MRIALDIDDTLADSRGYYMAELYKKYGAPDNMTLDDVMKTYDIIPNIPFWQTEEIIAWLDKESFSSEAQERIAVVPGAEVGVTQLGEMATIVCYMTTRPPSAIDGTKKWLLKHGFPNVPVIYRPDVNKNGYEWKADELKEQYPEVDTIIDNSPELAAFLQDYKGTFFLFYDKKVENIGSNVVPCKTWSDVVGAVKKQQNVI